MLKWFIGWRLGAFERANGYDATYVREILAASRRAFFALARLSAIARYHEDVPPAALYAAKLAATMHEDCGPCTQLAAGMAERAGVDSEIIRAILGGDEDAMGEEAALGYGFAQATLAHDLAASDGLRERIEAKWGRRAVISLAYAIVTGRMYPTLKYAMGHGRACARVTVGGRDCMVRHRELMTT